MSQPPIQLSEIIIQHPEVNSFQELLKVIRRQAAANDRFLLEMDLKPDFPDTPRNWQILVESAFVYRDD